MPGSLWLEANWVDTFVRNKLSLKISTKNSWLPGIQKDYTSATFADNVLYMWHYPAKEMEVVALPFTSTLSNYDEIDELD